jgi:transcription antitermination protein NusB
VAEIVYLGLEERIAINEAIELAKRYSDDQGRKLINGVLRRVTEQLKPGSQSVSTENADSIESYE